MLKHNLRDSGLARGECLTDDLPYGLLSLAISLETRL